MVSVRLIAGISEAEACPEAQWAELAYTLRASESWNKEDFSLAVLAVHSCKQAYETH